MTTLLGFVSSSLKKNMYRAAAVAGGGSRRAPRCSPTRGQHKKRAVIYSEPEEAAVEAIRLSEIKRTSG